MKKIIALIMSCVLTIQSIYGYNAELLDALLGGKYSTLEKLISSLTNIQELHDLIPSQLLAERLSKERYWPFIKKCGHTSLIHLAALLNDGKVLTILLDGDKKLLEKRIEPYGTPLMFVCLNKNYEAAQTLMNWGAHLEVTTTANYTSLHYACMNGWYEGAALLLKHGAKITKTPTGKTLIEVLLGQLHEAPQPEKIMSIVFLLGDYVSNNVDFNNLFVLSDDSLKMYKEIIEATKSFEMENFVQALPLSERGEAEKKIKKLRCLFEYLCKNTTYVHYHKSVSSLPYYDHFISLQINDFSKKKNVVSELSNRSLAFKTKKNNRALAIKH